MKNPFKKKQKEKIQDPGSIKPVEPIPGKDLIIPIKKDQLQLDDTTMDKIKLLGHWTDTIGYVEFEGKHYTIEELEKICVNAEFRRDFFYANKIRKIICQFWKQRNQQMNSSINEIMISASKIKGKAG